MDIGNVALVEKSLKHAVSILQDDCGRHFYDADVIVLNLLHAFRVGTLDNLTPEELRRKIQSSMTEVEAAMKKLQAKQLEATGWISAVLE